MPYGNYAECPKCGKIARGDAAIEAAFGYRYDHTKPQSWCKECRSGKSNTTDTLNVWDAANIWASNGMDPDYMFGYTEEELRKALFE